MSSRVQISDLIKHPGSARNEFGEVPVEVAVLGGLVAGPAEFAVNIRSLTSGAMVKGTVRGLATLICTRCLKEWAELIEGPVEAVFRSQPEAPEEEFPIDSGGWIDLEPLVRDELSLAIPLRPLCSPDCRGLCTTCGADLNTSPCGGHGDESASPFAALGRLFESEDHETGSDS